MAHLIDLNSLANTLPAIPKLRESRKTGKSTGIVSRKTGEIQELDSVQMTRRMTLGSAVSIGLTGIYGGNNVSLAKDNGFWIDGPLPIPPIYNSKHHSTSNSWLNDYDSSLKALYNFCLGSVQFGRIQNRKQLIQLCVYTEDITNEQTGTRSFLKKGVYVADIGTKGRMYRVKKNAFDLLAMEDLIGPDTLNYVKKYLRLKSTFLFYDFDNLISVEKDKQPLIDLANRLFDNFEKVFTRFTRTN